MTPGQVSIIKACYARNDSAPEAAKAAGVSANIANCAYRRLKRGAELGLRHKRPSLEKRPPQLTPQLCTECSAIFDRINAALQELRAKLEGPALTDDRLAACLRVLRSARGNVADAIGEFRMRQSLATGAIAKAAAAEAATGAWGATEKAIA